VLVASCGLGTPKALFLWGSKRLFWGSQKSMRHQAFLFQTWVKMVLETLGSQPYIMVNFDETKVAHDVSQRKVWMAGLPARVKAANHLFREAVDRSDSRNCTTFIGFVPEI